MSSLPETLFAPAKGFTADLRFAGDMSPPEPEIQEDPFQATFAEGYARGFEDAAQQARLQAEQDAIARSRIEGAFERLSESEGLRLEERLRETVLALCEHTLAPMALDPDALNMRISKALMALRRSEDDKVLRLHPEDLALVAKSLPEDLKFEADPALARGELRIETPEGGLEDGPAQWRRVLAEALAL